MTTTPTTPPVTPAITLTINAMYSHPANMMLNINLRDGSSLVGLYEICRALVDAGVDLEAIFDNVLLARRVARWDATVG